MSGKTQELLDICEQLPEVERAKNADFARFLLAKHKNILDEGIDLARNAKFLAGVGSAERG